MKARLGGLPCQASFWISDSTVVCHIPGNPLGLSIRSDSGAVITVQGRLGSLTKFITYAEPNVTSINEVNSPATGKMEIVENLIVSVGLKKQTLMALLTHDAATVCRLVN